MRFVIREFQISDIDPVVGMWKATTGVLLDKSDSPERVGRFLTANPGLSFVAVDKQDQLLGSILCGHDTRRGYIYHLMVAENARRSGIGEALAARSLASLAAEGIHKCHIHVLRDNAPAEEFWTATGWERRDDILTLSRYTNR